MLSTQSFSATADGDNTIIAATAGKRIVVVSYHISQATAAGLAIWKSGAAGTEHMRTGLAVNGSTSHSGPRDTPAWVGDVGAALVSNNAASVDVVGRFTYYLSE